MDQPKGWELPLVVSGVLCLAVVAPLVRAASSSASAQVIIILPEREPAALPTAAEAEAPDANPWDTSSAPGMVRSTTVTHDGDAVRILHTEVAL